jgi:methyltransferase (TIGR00027 family)
MSDRLKEHQLLASTAYWTAAVRAAETARADRLFNDPWAQALAGPQGKAWIADRTPDSVLPIALRTRYYDDFLERITFEHFIPQIVLVAAGLDTRAYRLSWPPGIRLFELDQAPVLAQKRAVMGAAGAEAACRRTAIPADLTGDWEGDLIEAGYDPMLPSGWLLEGFLFYIASADLESVLDRAMRLTAPRSWIGFDAINSLILTSPITKSWVDMQAQSGAPWIGALDDPQAFLEERGWQANLVPIGAPEANYGRWSLPVIPANAPGLPHLWFVTGSKD